MLVDKDSASRLAIYSELSYIVISLAKLKEFLIVNSLWVRDSSIGIRNLAILYPGVLITDRIGRHFGKFLATGLWILGLPQSIHGL